MSSTTGADPDTVRFQVLGPVSVVCGDQRVQLAAHRQRIILAALLLDANRVVSIETLIDAVWEDAPPATARSQVYICVSAIRALLREFGEADLVETEPRGYRIAVADDQVDFRRFERMSANAVRLAGQGRFAEAASIQRAALGLWRGAALSDVDSAVTATRAARLDEDRFTAMENCADWELRLGRHQELTSELAERVAAHPLRERGRAQLMLALHRSGRQAEALETFRVGRRELIEQLGLEPGEELRRMEARILADDPTLRLGGPAPATGPVPARQLPADIADFVGRQEQIEKLTASVTDGGVATPVAVVTGPGGVGKSTLAVHVAHLLAAERFPDGQLYADLAGDQVGDVLGRFLRALGVLPDALPDTVAERAELYRSLLADRRVLVLLEDVATEARVRPLLPGSPSCAVLVTSRVRLTGLAGAYQVEVPEFGERDAFALLSGIVGADRVERERGRVAELTDLVGGLPLGLRIIGSRLLARPHWTLERLVWRLADESRRLDELVYGEEAIRSCIAPDYDALDGTERLLLRLLAEFGSEGLPEWMAGTVLDTDQSDTLEVLEKLVECRLVEVVVGTPTRYRVRGLVRIFVLEQSTVDERVVLWGGVPALGRAHVALARLESAAGV